MAAKNAQETEEFMVIARVEALIAGWGQEEALKRARAYADAGADAIFIHSKKSDGKEIEDFLKAWNNYKPVVLVPTNYPTFTEAKMKEYGVKLVIYANQGIRTIVKHVNETFAEIREKGITEIGSKIASVQDLFALQEMDKFREDQDKFVRTNEPVKAIIPAAGDRSIEPSLKELLQDRPLTMLDVNGKSILQRSVEALKRCGVDDINVIGGYKAEHIVADDINLIVNENYEQGHIMDSIEKAGDNYASKNLIIFSDIIFDNEILERLLKTENDITVVIDSSIRKTEERSDIELVIAENAPLAGDRVINVKRQNKILNIGKGLDRGKANYEFIGMVLLSKTGMEQLMKVYKDSGDKKMGLAQALQKLIDNGEKVNSLEINKGWSEIHDFGDYKEVSEMLAHEG
jgi:phosphoenolpyruvate phosphomutase